MGNLGGNLPALDVKTPAPPPSALAEFGQVAQIQSHLQAQQLQQQQIQENAQKLKNIQATTAAMQNWDPSTGDYDSLAKDVIARGGDANAAMAITQHGLQVKQLTANLSKDNLANYQAAHKAVGDAILPLTDPTQVPDEQLHGKALDTVMDLVNKGIMDRGTGQQAIQAIQTTQDPTALRTQIGQMGKVAQGAAATAAQQKTAAETAAETAKAANENAQAGLNQIKLNLAKNATPGSFDADIDRIYSPRDPSAAGQGQMFKGLVNSALSRGDVDTAKKYVDQAVQNQQQISEKLNPVIRQAEIHDATAKKAAEQAITDGDPKAAAQLLINGTVAPSQIISSRKPAFAQEAFTAASQMQPGWNAQKADADFNVAKSPNNVAFFGSAKSLTDKGGTLDQLADAAKDIPANQIPVFNSVADVWKAATGSGPVAKYASILLGVTDDYSKVMGGGQGSDSSRGQAINLVPLKASPEQRAAAIEGIRGAVGSQVNSRIGNNPVLRNMYGNAGPNEIPKNVAPANPASVAPSGKAVSLAAAKQLPSMQGKTDEQIKALIQAQGHAVAP
jgi:hypothetical protein